MPAFDLAVALGIERGGADVGHAAQPDERFEISGDELRSVVGDDPRRDAGMQLAGALQDCFDIGFKHPFAQVPVDDRSAAAVEHAAQEVERAFDVDVRDVHVPVLVHPERLDKASALAGGRAAAA